MRLYWLHPGWLWGWRRAALTLGRERADSPANRCAAAGPHTPQVVVKGNVDPQKVLETVAKTGKATQFWQ